MSYDIYINSKQRDFEKILNQIGFKQTEDRYTVIYERPTLNFQYRDKSLFTYLHGNSFNAIFMYRYLVIALLYVDGFSFTDPQMDKTFDKPSDLKILDWDYMFEVAKKYTHLSYSTVKTDQLIKKHFPIDRTIPVEYKTLHILCQDLFNKDGVYKKLAEQNICGYSPVPFLMINSMERTYRVAYPWAGLVDCILPADLQIDYVGLGNAWAAYKWDDLAPLLPEPEIVDLNEFGKYRYYKDIAPKFGDILEKLKNTPPEFPEHFSLDYTFSSPYSVL